MFVRLCLSLAIILSISGQSLDAQVNEHTPGYFAFPMPPDDVSPSFTDMSFLNPEPAGAAGPVSVRDGHFYDGRGQRLRLLGSNISFVGAFPEKDEAVKIAGRMRKLGMNVVRVHHMDQDVSPRGLWNADFSDFDPEQVDRLDWFLYQLQQHGIYVNLNLHIKGSYQGLPEGMPRAFRFGKGIDNFYRPYIENQKAYARKRLLHRNPYSGMTYAEDPGVVVIEINNENSLTHKSWEELRQLKDPIKSEFHRQWTVWLLNRYGSDGGVRAAWSGNSIASHDTGQDTPASVAAGVGKVYVAPPPKDAPVLQKRDFYHFLIETEMAYFKEMKRYLRDDLGIKVPVIGSQISYGEMQGIYREAMLSDYADYHTYSGHPQFPPGESWNLSGDWRISNRTLVASDKGGALTRASLYRIDGLPFSLSEIDHPFPNDYVAEMYPMWASFAAFQDWDAIYQYNYQSRLVDYQNPWISHYFELCSHPGKLAFHPVAAVMFRMGAVEPAKEMVAAKIPVGDNLMEHLAASGKNLGSEVHQTLRPLSTIHRVGLRLSDTVKTITPDVESVDILGRSVSDTGQIVWDRSESGREYYMVNAPAVRSVVGYIGGRTIKLGDVSITVHESASNWASVAVAALDGKPVNESQRVLVVVVGRVVNSNMHWNKDRTGVQSVPPVEATPAGNMPHWGEAPIVAEAVKATICMPGGRVQALDVTGSPKMEVPIREVADGIEFTTDAAYQTLWYAVTPK
jgi:hypothetical protein